MIVYTHPSNVKYLKVWIGQCNKNITHDVSCDTKPLATLDYCVNFLYNGSIYTKDLMGRDGTGYISIRRLDGLKDKIPASTKVYTVSINNTTHLDGFYEFLTTIIEDDKLPISKAIKTGEIIWSDNKFINYSSGPTSNMSHDDYISMCKYFGWAKDKFEHYLIWYKDNNEYLAPYMEIE